MLFYFIDVNVSVFKILFEFNFIVGKIIGYEIFVNKELFNKKCFRNIYGFYFIIL